MTWHLEVSSGPDSGLKTAIDNDVVIIGGDANQSTFVLTDETVSRLHATVTAFQDGTIQVEDYNSTCGTFINGYAITGPANLVPEDLLKIGNTEISLTWSTEASNAPDWQAPSTAISIGRDPLNTLVINDPRVSRRHACLERRGTLFYLTDLNSTYGTYLNGKNILGTQVIEPSSWVNIGDINYFFDGKNLKTEQGAIAATLGEATGSGSLSNRFSDSNKKSKNRTIKIAALILGIFFILAGAYTAYEYLGTEKTMSWANGIYSGQVKLNIPQGEGIWQHPDGIIYEGQWSNGLPQGKGKMTTEDGAIYVGNFENASFSGQGNLSWISGASYVGEFKGGQFFGKGTYTWPDGSQYIGEFVDNLCHGEGTYIWPDGQSSSGRWENDQYVTN